MPSRSREQSKKTSNAHLRVIARLESSLSELRPEGRPSRETLRERAEAVLAATANVDCAILIANDRGRYISVNRAAVGLTGYREAELLTMSVWELTPAANVAAGRTQWEEFLRRGRMQGTYELQRKNGTPIRVTFSAVAHVLPGIHLSAMLPA